MKKKAQKKTLSVKKGIGKYFVHNVNLNKGEKLDNFTTSISSLRISG